MTELITKRYTNSNYVVDILRICRSPRDAKGNLILATNPMIHIVGGADPEGDLSENLYGTWGDLYYCGNLAELVGRNFPDLYRDCYAKFKSKAFEKAEAALAVDFAELHETISMIDGTLARLIRAARHVRRGRFDQAARDLNIPKPKKLWDVNRRFAENWLAYRYGWQPLYSSIASTLEAFDKPPRDHFVEATVKDRKSIQDSIVGASIKMKGRVIVESPITARLNQMGLLNPLSVAWELVPFSFVADWFLPISSYLENLTGFAGLSFRDASTTYHASGRRYLWYSNVLDDWIMDRREAPYNREYDHPGTSYWYWAKQRFVGDYPRPPLGGLNNGFNPKRLLDSITLLQSVLLGKRK